MSEPYPKSPAASSPSPGDRVRCRPTASVQIDGTVVSVIVPAAARRLGIVWDGTMLQSYTTGLKANVGIIDDGGESCDDGHPFEVIR